MPAKRSRTTTPDAGATLAGTRPARRGRPPSGSTVAVKQLAVAVSSFLDAQISTASRFDGVTRNDYVRGAIARRVASTLSDIEAGRSEDEPSSGVPVLELHAGPHGPAEPPTLVKLSSIQVPAAALPTIRACADHQGSSYAAYVRRAIVEAVSDSLERQASGAPAQPAPDAYAVHWSARPIPGWGEPGGH